MLFLKWRAEILRYICIPDILVGCLVMILWIFHNVPPRVRSAVHYLWHCVLHCDVVVKYFVVNKCGWLYADVLLSFIVWFFFFWWFFTLRFPYSTWFTALVTINVRTNINRWTKLMFVNFKTWRICFVSQNLNVSLFLNVERFLNFGLEV